MFTLGNYLTKLVELVESQTKSISDLEQTVLLLTERIMVLESRSELLDKRHVSHIHNVKTGYTSTPTKYEN